MGGAVSSGRNNDDLIDNLLEADYIKTSLIERVFRAVDRAEYFLPDARGDAYKDLAWKKGNLHISAPCIYSEVMEALDLVPGLSFLNLGSGTGYLSTMVGLILGTNGINHGIDVHDDVIEYAYRKLEDFKKFSGAIDEYDFCEPKFIQGNCLAFTGESIALYDRIYCGAACPEEFQQYMQSMIKVGGILVMPLNDRLLQIKRLSETEWKERSLLPVSFASLVVPPDGFQDFIKPIEVDPLPLQMLCRSVVRNILRKSIEKEHPPVKNTPHVKAPKKKRTLRRLMVPLLDDMDSSDEERQVRLGGERNRDAGRAAFRREDDGIFSLFLGVGMRRASESERSRSNPSLNSRGARRHRQASNMETDEQDTEDSVNNNGQATSQQVRAIIEHHGSDEDLNDPNINNAYLDEEGTMQQINDVIEECLVMLRDDAIERDEQHNSTGMNENAHDSEVDDDNQCKENPSQSDLESATTTKPSTSTVISNKNGKREKSDSGLGDEIIEAQDSSDDDQMKLDVISSCDEDCTLEKRYKRGILTSPHIQKFRRIDMCRRLMGSSSDTEEDIADPGNDIRMYQSVYTQYMVEKIQELPLPPILKKYLNYYRDINIKIGE